MQLISHLGTYNNYCLLKWKSDPINQMKVMLDKMTQDKIIRGINIDEQL
jgi:hypothetical protein